MYRVVAFLGGKKAWLSLRSFSSVVKSAHSNWVSRVQLPTSHFVGVLLSVTTRERNDEIVRNLKKSIVLKLCILKKVSFFFIAFKSQVIVEK